MSIAYVFSFQTPELNGKVQDKSTEQSNDTPDRQKVKKRTKGEKSPNAPSAKKQRTQKSVTRLRAMKKDSDSDLSTSFNENSEENNNTDKENKDSNIPDINSDIVIEKKDIFNNHMKNENIHPVVSNGLKKIITCKDLTTRGMFKITFVGSI